MAAYLPDTKNITVNAFSINPIDRNIMLDYYVYDVDSVDPIIGDQENARRNNRSRK
jgi:hypothetical protein